MSTKIHALIEGLGMLARWTLTGGQVHDLTQAQTVVEDLPTQAVVADKAYDADELIQSIADQGAAAVIPPRSNCKQPRTFDTHQNRHRNFIERFFCRMKHFRRIGPRYDKLASRFSSFIALGASFFWLE